jgi:hypothetical protein
MLKSDLQMVAMCKKSVQSILHNVAIGFKACKAHCTLLQRGFKHVKILNISLRIMNMRFWSYFFVSLLLLSCSSGKRSKLDTILPANANKEELKKVLNHYKNPFDKEKYEAAWFLISNMENKYSLEGEPLDKYFTIYEDILSRYKTGIKSYKVLDSIAKVEIDSMEAYYGPIKPSELIHTLDVTVINADSIIENIDLAFEVWKTKPWAKHINFKQFCEYILPYRVSNEPLQYWRSYLKNKYDLFGDSLKNPSDPKEIARKVNTYLYRDWKHLDNFSKYPYFAGVRDIDHYKGGICEHHYLLLACILRSLGVACAIDFTPQWKHWAGKHSWMTILDTTGNMIAFNPGNPHFYYTHKAPLGLTGSASKVYRRTFEIQSESLPENTGEGEYIPSPFNDSFIKDVTNEYDYQQSDIELEVTSIPKNKVLYLSVFGYGLNHEQIGWTKTNEHNARFKNVGIPALFLPGYFEDGKEYFTSEPFIYYPDKVVKIIPDTTKRIIVRLDRKFPVDDSMLVYLKELIGGKFQGANSPDFKNADDLFVIHDTIGSFVDKIISNNNPYRYVRLLATSKGRINISEIEFYGENDKNQEIKLTGKMISSGKIMKGKPGDAFDNNSATSLSSIPGSWIGLDLGQAKQIEKIRYLPRNELNGIEIGDLYELFYFFDGQWHSLGKKVADKNYLIFENVPEGALLVLKNLSEGKDERIFTYKNNKQIWY